MTHYLLLAGYFPLAGAVIWLWRSNHQLRGEKRAQSETIADEQRKNRKHEENFNEVLAMLLVAVWHWTYHEDMHWHFKAQTAQSRARENVAQQRLAAERKRSSLRAMLANLLSRVIPVPAPA
jgi:hypothetical protein